MDFTKAYILDIETYPNCLLVAVMRADGKHRHCLEVSNRKNEFDRIIKMLDHVAATDSYIVTFNGIGFDYPILHELYHKQLTLPKSGEKLAKKAFDLAQKQIDSFKDDGFGNTIKSEDSLVKHLDLYKIWHFNNKAKATSLKLLEFNMRMQNIEDLPFAVGQYLTSEEIDRLIAYNQHDIEATRMFFNASQEQIDFRLALSAEYGKDWLNCDDTKIGAEYFAMRLQEQGVKLYKYKDGKRVLNQTPRKEIKLKECLFDYYDFQRPEFIAMQEWFSKQVITETKGVFSDIEEHLLFDVAKYAHLETKRVKFKQKPTDAELAEFKKLHPLGWIEEQPLKATEYAFDANGQHIMEYPLDADGCIDLSKKPKKKRIPKISYWGCYRVAETLNVIVDGFRFDFGTGGIHGSVSGVVKEDTDYELQDLDVVSFYPNLSIANRVYPEHLGETFCDIYQDMFEQRKSFAKGSAKNAMLKLALNGTYGKSNDKYSVFFDPKFTIFITVNGQLSLCLLVDYFYRAKIDFQMLMANTDGITIKVNRADSEKMYKVVKYWQKKTKLEMENVAYKQMFIRDVNNYIGVYTTGKCKYKGAYQYQGLEWHKNQGGLIIPMAACEAMINGVDVEKFILQHKQEFDFMLRTKVPRSSRLVMQMQDGKEVLQQNVCRYYASKTGGKLVKIMPALEGSTEERRLGIDTEYNVKTCNDMLDFTWDIDYNYYINEAKKLIVS